MPSHLQLAGPRGDPNTVDRPITVVLADEHAGMRRSLRLLLDPERDVMVLSETADLPSTLERLHDLRPDVLVADLALPPRRRIEAIPELRAHAPDTQIIVLTMERNAAFAHRAIAAGALGFVLNDQADRDLPAAVRAAARHHQFISPIVEHNPEAAAPTPAPPELDGLTADEIEVLRLIAFGHTTSEVARRLRLEPRAVEMHRARVHAKLGLVTRAELVSYALRHGLLRD